MLNKIVMLILLLGSVAACSDLPQFEKNQQVVSMANPASEYCVQQGGRVEIRNQAQGQVGYCHLSQGKVIEEWEFFRQQARSCSDQEAQKLVGHQRLAEAQIKNLTQAKQLRVVHPNQALTLDYRAERVTLVVDPDTQVVLQASCG